MILFIQKNSIKFTNRRKWSQFVDGDPGIRALILRRVQSVNEVIRKEGEIVLSVSCLVTVPDNNNCI